MTAEIVNLRRARKQKTRAERDSVASANRARHGRSLAERAAQEKEGSRHARHLDGHLRAVTNSARDDA